jgi:hypothetical protein
MPEGGGEGEKKKKSKENLLFISDLFNDTVNRSNYIVLNDRMISE